MAINPSTLFTGKITAPNSDYPYGSARDIVTPGDGLGTPLKASWLNDIWGFLQALLSESSITPNGNPDKVGSSQYLQALQSISSSSSSNFGCYVIDTTTSETSHDFPLLGTRIDVTDPAYAASSFDFKGIANWAQPGGASLGIHFEIKKLSGGEPFAFVNARFLTQSGSSLDEAWSNQGSLASDASVVTATAQWAYVNVVSIERVEDSDELCFRLNVSAASSYSATLSARMSGQKTYSGSSVSSSNGTIF
jgi:hypothetical protein